MSNPPPLPEQAAASHQQNDALTPLQTSVESAPLADPHPYDWRDEPGPRVGLILYRSWLQAGDLDVTVFQDAAGQGAGALDAAIKLSKGEAVEQKVYIPFKLVTPANIGDFLTKN